MIVHVLDKLQKGHGRGHSVVESALMQQKAGEKVLLLCNEADQSLLKDLDFVLAPEGLLPHRKPEVNQAYQSWLKPHIDKLGKNDVINTHEGADLIAVTNLKPKARVVHAFHSHPDYSLGCWDKQLLKQAVNKTNAILVWGETLSMAVQIKYNVSKTKIFVLSSAADKPKLFNNNKWHGSPTIATVARLDENKNIGRLIDAVAVLSEVYPDIKLEIFGKGPLLEKLKAKCCRLNVEDKVVFHGGNDNVKEAIREVDLFVLPSFTEGVPRSVREAGLREIPLCVSFCCAEMVYNGLMGEVFDPWSVDSLISAIERSLNNPQRQQIAKQLAEKMKQDYAPKKIMEVYQKAYSKS